LSYGHTRPAEEHGAPWVGWASGQVASELPPLADRPPEAVEPPALLPPDASELRPPASVEVLPPVASWKSTSPLGSAAEHAAPSRASRPKTNATDSTLEVFIATTTSEGLGQLRGFMPSRGAADKTAPVPRPAPLHREHPALRMGCAASSADGGWIGPMTQQSRPKPRQPGRKRHGVRCTEHHHGRPIGMSARFSATRCHVRVWLWATSHSSVGKMAPPRLATPLACLARFTFRCELTPGPAASTASEQNRLPCHTLVPWCE
jgi:hypothetical protein